MKAFATGAAAVILLASGAIHTSASTPHTRNTALRGSLNDLVSARIHTFGHLGVQSLLRPASTSRNVAEQTGGNPTATTATPGTAATPGTTATVGPTPSTTSSPYPDPVPILQSTIDVYGKVARAHFQVVTDAEQTNVERLHVDARGDASCKGPSFKAQVTAKDTSLKNKQSKSASVRFVVIKNQGYYKVKGAAWKKIKPSNITVYSIPIEQPLICQSSSSGSSGSGSSSNNTQIKDVTNLGPDTFQGIPVWHIRATEVNTDTNGTQSEATLDFLISQKGSLPYVLSFKAVDTQQKVTITQKQTLTKFGEKLTIKAPIK